MTANGKLTPEEFVYLALEKLKKPGYNGIHAVYSGFNDAFRAYFSGSDPVAFVNAMAEEGKIRVRKAKGGAVIYPPNGPGPETPDALKQMGLD